MVIRGNEESKKRSERERERDRKKKRGVNGAVRNGTTAAVIGISSHAVSGTSGGCDSDNPPPKSQRGKKHDSNDKKKVESGELCVSSMIFQ